MLYERKKILINRLVLLGLLLLGIIIPIIIVYAPPKEIEIVDDNGYVNHYYETLNATDCEVEVTFNINVDSGYITVAFYDSSDNLLAQKEQYFFGYGKTLSSTFYIDGEVDSYEIISYDISSSISRLCVYIFAFVDIILFPFFISSLLLSYKAYEYNGNEIVVYAGWYHHYIKVNGEKFDEHNTLISFTAILLSCSLNDGTDIKATISMTNRISLKINNQLYTKREEYVR